MSNSDYLDIRTCKHICVHLVFPIIIVYCDAVDVDSDRFYRAKHIFFAFGTDLMLANFSIDKFTGSVLVRCV